MNFHGIYRFIGMASACALIWLTGSESQAQQTIFNVPSADVADPRQLFLQHESQFRAWKPGRFLNNTEYATYGIGKHIELDATLFNVNAPATHNIALGLGFKMAQPLFVHSLPSEELKLTIGEEVPVALQGNQGVGDWTYLHLSGRLPRLHTRLTAGVNAGTKQIFGRNTVGFVGGIEHPINKRLTLIADWYSGTHALGYLISGFSVALPKAFTCYAGYQVPNNRRVGRSGFVMELCRFF